MPSVIPDNYQPGPSLLAAASILVTGAGQGLGRAVALACAAHGATVALLGRKLEKLEATYDAIVAAGGPEPALIPARSRALPRRREYDDPRPARCAGT